MKAHAEVKFFSLLNHIGTVANGVSNVLVRFCEKKSSHGNRDIFVTS